MRILVTGATGFIGSAIVEALRERGHTIVACVHYAHPRALPAGMETVAVDYSRDLTPAAWLPRLAGVEVVINAVGILRERPGALFATIHDQAPRALFRACEEGKVRRVIQISALGAEAGASSRYHQSKRAADEALRGSTLDWTIVQPSVVFGPRGASTQLFLQLASLPVVPLVGRGDQQLQPVHITDLVTLVRRLVEDGAGSRQTLAAVGPEAVSMRTLLAGYRRALGLGRSWFLPGPLTLVRLAARVGDIVKSGALSTETLHMLLQGNTGPVEPMQNILGHPPRALNDFIHPAEAASLRARAVWGWFRPALLVSVALVWLVAGVTSWLFYQQPGLALLQKLGLASGMAQVAFALACVVNVVLGVLTLAKPGRGLWQLQFAIMVFYTLALAWVEPALWADPFGPLVKNLPLAVVLLGLMAEGQEA